MLRGSRPGVQSASLIGAFYNITKNKDNPIKIVGRDSFLSPQTPKNTSFLGVTQPLYSRGHN